MVGGGWGRGVQRGAEGEGFGAEARLQTKQSGGVYPYFT